VFAEIKVQEIDILVGLYVFYYQLSNELFDGCVEHESLAGCRQ
jgi:hypothetical protein